MFLQSAEGDFISGEAVTLEFQHTAPEEDFLTGANPGILHMPLQRTIYLWQQAVTFNNPQGFQSGFAPWDMIINPKDIRICVAPLFGE